MQEEELIGAMKLVGYEYRGRADVTNKPSRGSEEKASVKAADGDFKYDFSRDHLGDELRASITVYHTGAVVFGGKGASEARTLYERLKPALADEPLDCPQKGKVLIVYGRDLAAKRQVKRMLRLWNVEPVEFERDADKGQTIIEKFEKMAADADYAIVLATPDDVGFDKSKPNEAQLRARQNVILELGMMLARLGRERVTIIKRDPVLPSKGESTDRMPDTMELPSDLDGLILKCYSRSIADISSKLAKELASVGLLTGVQSLESPELL